MTAREEMGLQFWRAGWVLIVLLTAALFVMAVPLRFEQLQRVCAGIACTELQLTADDLRVLRDLGMTIRFYAGFNVALEVIFALVHFAVAGVIFARRSNDRMALFTSLMLITFGAAAFTGTLNALAPRPWAWRLPISLVSSLPDVLPSYLSRTASLAWLPVGLVSALGQVLIAVFFYTFPTGRFVPRWSVALIVLWLAWQVPAIFFPTSNFNAEHWPAVLAGAAWIAFLVSCVFAQVYRYRYVSGPLQRQQTKWVLWGVTIGLGGIFGAILISGLLSTLGLSNLLGRMTILALMYTCMLALPVSIGLAITRSHLWEIDVLINRALVYAVLSGTLAVVYFGSIVLLQTLLQPWLGQGQSDVLLVLSTLAAAALFSPVKNEAQKLIDQRFYRSKYDAAHTVAAFAATLRHQVEIEKLSADLLRVVEQTMQPSELSLWLRNSERDK